MNCPEGHDYTHLTVIRLQRTKLGRYRIDYECDCGERFNIHHRKGILKHPLIVEYIESLCDEVECQIQRGEPIPWQK